MQAVAVIGGNGAAAGLVARDSAMDANLSRLNALSSYVSQQLAALTQNKQGNG